MWALIPLEAAKMEEVIGTSAHPHGQVGGSTRHLHGFSQSPSFETLLTCYTLQEAFPSQSSHLLPPDAPTTQGSILIGPRQGFSTLALLTSGSFCDVEAVLCTVRHLAASLASAYQIPTATTPPHIHTRITTITTKNVSQCSLEGKITAG